MRGSGEVLVAGELSIMSKYSLGEFIRLDKIGRAKRSPTASRVQAAVGSSFGLLLIVS